MRQYIRLCLSALLMLGVSMTALAEQTPAEAAAAAVIANPSQAPQIAADAVANNPEHAAAIIEAVLAACPECNEVTADPSLKHKSTAATMAIINAVLMAVPSVTNDVINAAKDKPGYDPDKVSPPDGKEQDKGTDSGGTGGGISP